MNYHKMPFGKFKGETIDEIPSTYLVYALEKFEMPLELEEGMREELIVRFDLFTPSSRQASSPIDKKINSAYRIVSKKYHPDTGGSHEAMTAINEFKSLLK